MSALKAVDYFFVVGPASYTPTPTSASARSFIDRTYRSSLLFRFPPVDHPHLSFPPGVEMFCIPDDLRLSTAPLMPKFHYFVVTGGAGERLYGSCLRFYEELHPDAQRLLEREDARVSEVIEAKEREERERRKREISVSLSREEEREAELEEEMERGQAQRLMSMHQRIQEEQAKWRERQSTSPQREEKEGKVPPPPPHPPHPLAIQVQSTAQSPSSAATPEPPSPNISPAPRVRSVSSTPAASSPTTSPSPHLLCPPSSTSTPTLRSRKVYSPKCIAVLSLYPFLSQSREFLSELYRISLVPSHLPLEHLIANFVNEIPLPPLGEVKVQFAVSNKLIYFFRPPPNNPLLCTHYPLRLLFECLDSENALSVVEAVLLEQRILLLSSKLSALTVVAETLLHLIFPFRWPHVYIPLLPRSLIDFLFAPMPFIIGMHHSYVKGALTEELLSDIIVVDLDSNRVTLHGQDGAVAKRLRQLPARERKKIKRGLSLLHLYRPKAQRSEYEKRMLESMDDAFSYAPSPDEIEQLMASQEREAEELRRLVEAEAGGAKSPLGSPTSLDDAAAINHELFISSVFFRAFTSLMKEYVPYLIHPSASDPHPDPCFNKRAFLRHHDQSSHAFLSDLLSTQAFTAFCEERIYASHSASHDVRFFDESITAKKNRSRLTRRTDTPFLTDPRYIIKETYIVPSADVTGCKGLYRYDVWPALDVKLFPIPRRIPAFYSKRQMAITVAAGVGGGDKATSADALGGVRFGVALSTLEQVLYTVWFMLVTSIAGEYQLHHCINTAFKVLYDARLSGVRLEEDVFIRLMKACGACSIPDKAVEVLSIMQECGHVVDGVVYGQLLQVFSMKGGEGMEALKRLGQGGRREGLLYSPAHSPRPSVSRGDESEGELAEVEGEEEDFTEPEVSTASSTVSSSSMQSPSSHEPRGGSRRRVTSPTYHDEGKRGEKGDGEAADERKADGLMMSPTAALNPREEEEREEGENAEGDGSPDLHNAIAAPSPDDLTRFHRNFIAAYPHLTIDTTDRCPECRRELSDREIRAGWTDRTTDYTTTCPKCGERFAAQFVVSANPKVTGKVTTPLSPSHQGMGTEEDQYNYQRQLQGAQYVALNAASHTGSERFPLTLPYLPPRVLKKEVGRVIDEHGIGYITHPSFRLHSTTLYWNLAWHLLCVALPVQLLLWDMTDVKGMRKERMEMVHVMRSMSDEERERRHTQTLDRAAAKAARAKQTTARRAAGGRLADSSLLGRDLSRTTPSPSPSSPLSTGNSPLGQRLSPVAELT